MFKRVILANVTITVKPPMYSDRPLRFAAMKILNGFYYQVLEAETDCVHGVWTDTDKNGYERGQYDEDHDEMTELRVEHTTLDNAVSYANAISYLGDVDDFDVKFDRVWVEN